MVMSTWRIVHAFRRKLGKFKPQLTLSTSATILKAGSEGNHICQLVSAGILQATYYGNDFIFLACVLTDWTLRLTIPRNASAAQQAAASSTISFGGSALPSTSCHFWKRDHKSWQLSGFPETSHITVISKVWPRMTSHIWGGFAPPKKKKSALWLRAAP